jgi:hypothetical protein
MNSLQYGGMAAPQNIYMASPRRKPTRSHAAKECLDGSRVLGHGRGSTLLGTLGHGWPSEAGEKQLPMAMGLSKKAWAKWDWHRTCTPGCNNNMAKQIWLNDQLGQTYNTCLPRPALAWRKVCLDSQIHACSKLTNDGCLHNWLNGMAQWLQLHSIVAAGLLACPDTLVQPFCCWHHILPMARPW